MEHDEPKITTTITLDPVLRDRLDRSAAAMERSRSWLVSKALSAFLGPIATTSPAEHTQETN